MRKTVPATLAVVLSVALSACGSSTSSLPKAWNGLSGAAIIAQIRAATLNESGVHVEQTATFPAQVQSQIDEVGVTSGRQELSITSNGVVRHASILLVNGTVYLKENRSMMLLQFAKAPANLVEHWISIPSSNINYRSFASALLMGTIASQSFPSGAITVVGRTTYAGLPAYEIRGSIAAGAGATGTLRVYTSTKAPYLLRAEVAQATSQGQSGTIVVTFSNWGSAYFVGAPKGAIAMSKTTLP